MEESITRNDPNLKHKSILVWIRHSVSAIVFGSKQGLRFSRALGCAWCHEEDRRKGNCSREANGYSGHPSTGQLHRWSSLLFRLSEAAQ